MAKKREDAENFEEFMELCTENDGPIDYYECSKTGHCDGVVANCNEWKKILKNRKG